MEGFRRYFARHTQGRRVESVEVRAADIVRNTSPQALGRALKGRRFASPRRHGKWLIAPATRRHRPAEDDPRLLLHFGMTGGLVWEGGAKRPHVHDRVIIHFRDGQMRYRNMRKLGGVWLARGEAEVAEATGALGPDAGRVDRERFEELLSGRRGGLKATLMNQRLIAGVGNELSDEILWRARLNPRRPVSRLRPTDRDRLHRAMRRMIRESIRHAHIPRKRGWLTSQRSRRDATCPRCGRSLRRETIAGRTAYWCPRCQRG